MKSNNDYIINNKCAPANIENIAENGTCFPTNIILKLAKELNIDNNTNTFTIVKNIEKELSNECSNHECLKKLSIFEKLNIDIENIFRPNGPNKKYGWLSTLHINDVLKQYEYKYTNFLFLGAVPYDFEDLKMLNFYNINFNELKNNNKTKLGMVINLDEHYKNGSHWVGLYIDLLNYKVYFFDSVGKPPRKRIKHFISKVKKYFNNDLYSKYKKPQFKYNNIQHQFKNSECGVYSINFIIRLLNGESFKSIINNRLNDDKINTCRKVYFSNVN